MKKVFLIVSVLLFFCPDIFGQNTIDKLMGQYSTLGNSVYSSIVKRDPNTKKVKSVYNELKISNNMSGLNKFIRAFDNEAKNVTRQEKNVNGSQVNYLLRDEKDNQTRLYMLEYFNNHGFISDITISIIIKNK